VGPHPHDLYLATAGRSAVIAAVICLVEKQRSKFPPMKQKTPPVVAGQWMLGRVSLSILSAAPLARHVTVMMMVVMPVRDKRHEAISLLHAAKWCQTVAR
jgi:hypothetical protein